MRWEDKRLYTSHFLSQADMDMEKDPLVSIITPSYNQGAYLEETIKSVLGQDYSNIEYLVVDGCSSDGTLDILRKYESKIRWLSEKDEGQADAINKGIRMTKGGIIAWLNSDDILLPGAITKVVDCFFNHPEAALIYGKSYFIDRGGKTIGKYPTETLILKRLAMFNFICQPSAFFQRQIFNDVGGLNTSLQYTMDYDLWIRIVHKYPAEFLTEFLSGYRLHPSSKTVDQEQGLSNQKEGLETAFRYYRWAPVNRVYGYCYHFIEQKLSSSMKKLRPVTIILSLILSVIKYMQINKKIRIEDIRAINPENLKKLGTPWQDLYKSY